MLAASLTPACRSRFVRVWGGEFAAGRIVRREQNNAFEVVRNDDLILLINNLDQIGRSRRQAREIDAAMQMRRRPGALRAARVGRVW